MCNPTIAIAITPETLPIIAAAQRFDVPEIEKTPNVFLILCSASNHETTATMTVEDFEQMYERDASKLTDWSFVTA